MALVTAKQDEAKRQARLERKRASTMVIGYDPASLMSTFTAITDDKKYKAEGNTPEQAAARLVDVLEAELLEMQVEELEPSPFKVLSEPLTGNYYAVTRGQDNITGSRRSELRALAYLVEQLHAIIVSLKAREEDHQRNNPGE